MFTFCIYIEGVTFRREPRIWKKAAYGKSVPGDRDCRRGCKAMAKKWCIKEWCKNLVQNRASAPLLEKAKPEKAESGKTLRRCGAHHYSAYLMRFGARRSMANSA